MKKIKKGDNVVLLTGSRENRGKTFKVLQINDNKVLLEGYKTVKKTKKINQENTENFQYLPVMVHISNLSLATEDKHGRVGFAVDETGKSYRTIGKDKIKVI